MKEALMQNKKELAEQYTQQANELSKLEQVMLAMRENMVKIVGKIELIDKLIQDESKSSKETPKE